MPNNPSSSSSSQQCAMNLTTNMNSTLHGGSYNSTCHGISSSTLSSQWSLPMKTEISNSIPPTNTEVSSFQSMTQTIPHQGGISLSQHQDNPFVVTSGNTNQHHQHLMEQKSSHSNLMHQQQNNYPSSSLSANIQNNTNPTMASSNNNSSSSLLDMMLQRQRMMLSNTSQTNYHNHMHKCKMLSATNLADKNPGLYNNNNMNDSNEITSSWNNVNYMNSSSGMHHQMINVNPNNANNNTSSQKSKSNTNNKPLQFHVHHLSNVATSNSPSSINDNNAMTNTMHNNLGTVTNLVHSTSYSSGSSSSSSLLSLMTSDSAHGGVDIANQQAASLPTNVIMTSHVPSSSNQSSPHQQQYMYSSPQPNNLSITPSNPQTTHSSQQIFYSGILPPIHQNLSEDSDSSDECDVNSNPEDECEFHPIACVQCRQLHKKCDKRLPSCSKCVSRGVECTYRTPKRNTTQPQQKKKKKKKNRSKASSLSPYMPIIPNRAKSKIVDIYFTCLAGDFPLISREELEYYLDDQNCPPGTPNKREVEVLFAVIRALVEQRCGTIEEATTAMLEARHALSTVFCHHSNFYVATAFCYMSFVESLNHDLKTAKFFLQCCEFYLECLASENVMDTRAQLLKKAHAYAKISSCNNRIPNDYSGNVMDMIKQIPQMYTLSTGQTLPPEFHHLVSQEITENNYQDMLDVIDTLTKLMYAQTSNILSKTAESKPLSKIEIVYLFISNGLKIAILTKAGQRKDIIEDCALRITYTTYTDLYPFCSIDMISYVALAARVHFHIVRAIEAGQRSAYNTGITSLDGSTFGPIDYYDILAHDLRAINLLKRHLKNPSAYYDGLVNEITQTLLKKGISVDNLQSSVQFSALVDTLQSDLEAVAFSTDPVM
ncbi:hypothetical protein FDP41_008351 [Naegleria fowleri]|uniref:Zn(2)-C6 fungal-type domain-containing protein n=1 Tax=Naegleria fowleri TaxID=5763 RepID=A0A6A5BGH9_NAEFO|nr:uncharacterized protein FDP41_008351 [Naegleria fowleri]KAF0973144.1 hypothetical protein FDP41_008351 [Naegleria fowleri]